MLNIKIVAAFLKLNLLSSEEMIELANDYLQAGKESPSLVLLAGLQEPYFEEAQKLLTETMIELEVAIPDLDQAVRTVAKHYATLICLREITPYEGAKAIWWKAYNNSDNSNDDLKVFVAAVSEIVDLPERYADEPRIANKYIREWEEEIIKAAEKLIS